MIHVARFVIKEISDKDFDPNFIPKISLENYSVRKAARGIVIHNRKVALLHVTKYNYHKLPGGGIEEGEGNEEAFKREVLEETGCECIIDDEEGQNSVTIETLEKLQLFHISYVFSANVKGIPKDVTFTQKEMDEGFKLKWVTLNEAEEILEQDKPTTYQGKFINTRDKAIFQFWKKQLT